MQRDALFPHLSFNWFGLGFVLTVFFLKATSSDSGEQQGEIGEKVPFGTSTEHLLYFCI